MEGSSATSARPLGTVLRQEEQVTPLELFFDLVFVLALTQCTTLMADTPTWGGLARGLLILGVLWWSWVGYSWLTSVVDPEEGAVRIAMFAVMAALPRYRARDAGAFDDDGLYFRRDIRLRACRTDRALRAGERRRPRATQIGRRPCGEHRYRRRSARRPRPSPTGSLQRALWGGSPPTRHGRPVPLRSGGLEALPAPLRRASRPDPDHRPRRVDRCPWRRRRGGRRPGRRDGRDAWNRAAACPWWIYFDVVSPSPSSSLTTAQNRAAQQNEIARDSYSYLHFRWSRGSCWSPLGAKKTLEHVGDDAGDRACRRTRRRRRRLPPRARRVQAAHRHTFTRSGSSARLSGSRSCRWPSSYPLSRRSRSCSPPLARSSSTSSPLTGVP